MSENNFEITAREALDLFTQKIKNAEGLEKIPVYTEFSKKRRGVPIKAPFIVTGAVEKTLEKSDIKSDALDGYITLEAKVFVPFLSKYEIKELISPVLAAVNTPRLCAVGKSGAQYSDGVVAHSFKFKYYVS